MKFIPPTYKEYSDATQFARIRYKFGVYIQLISMLLLIYLLFYTITNIEEMKAEPIAYAEKTRGVVCSTPFNLQISQYNGSYRNINYTKER